MQDIKWLKGAARVILQVLQGGVAIRGIRLRGDGGSRHESPSWAFLFKSLSCEYGLDSGNNDNNDKINRRKQQDRQSHKAALTFQQGASNHIMCCLRSRHLSTWKSLYVLVAIILRYYPTARGTRAQRMYAERGHYGRQQYKDLRPRNKPILTMSVNMNTIWIIHKYKKCLYISRQRGTQFRLSFGGTLWYKYTSKYHFGREHIASFIFISESKHTLCCWPCW